MIRGLAVVLLLLGVILGLLLHPVCVPLTDEEIMRPGVGLHQRGDRELWFKTVQYRDGRWCRCTTWLEHTFEF